MVLRQKCRRDLTPPTLGVAAPPFAAPESSASVGETAKEPMAAHVLAATPPLHPKPQTFPQNLTQFFA